MYERLLTGSSGWARRTEVAPGAAHVVPAAAVAVGQRHGQPVRALACLAQVRVATAHSPICTQTTPHITIIKHWKKHHKQHKM